VFGEQGAMLRVFQLMGYFRLGHQILNPACAAFGWRNMLSEVKSL